MARILKVDPVEFEKDWAESFDQRVSGQLGSLSETIRCISERQGVEPSSDHVEQALKIRLSFTKAHLEACEPLLPELDALRAAGVRLAVVSDASEEAPRLWPFIALGRRFEAAVFSCEEGFCKPDPRMYRLALQRLDLPAGRCAFVGDGGSQELTGATAVGLAAFLYRFPGDRAGPDSRYLPDREWKGPPLSSLRDLLPTTR